MRFAEITRERQKSRAKPPKRYGVFLLNDDYTPMDFVVEILCDIFAISEPKAVAIMLKVHHEGSGLCGIYSRDIAETKQQQVMLRASEEGFPLMCVIKEVE